MTERDDRKETAGPTALTVLLGMMLAAAPVAAQTDVGIELAGSVGTYGFAGDDFFEERSSPGWEGALRYRLGSHLQLSGGALFIHIDVAGVRPHVDHLEIFAEPRLTFHPGLGPLEGFAGVRGSYVTESLAVDELEVESTGFTAGLTAGVGLPLGGLGVPFIGGLLRPLVLEGSGLFQMLELGDRDVGGFEMPGSAASGSIVGGRVGLAIRF